MDCGGSWEESTGESASWMNRGEAQQVSRVYRVPSGCTWDPVGVLGASGCTWGPGGCTRKQWAPITGLLEYAHGPVCCQVAWWLMPAIWPVAYACYLACGPFCLQVLSVVQGLLRAGDLRGGVADIGVITPYSGQVQLGACTAC